MYRFSWRALVGLFAGAVALSAVACGSNPTPTPVVVEVEVVVTATPTPQGAHVAEWAAVQEAAKSEKLVINTKPGDGANFLIKEFKRAFPDIDVEHTTAYPSRFGPRIISEQQSGKFLWDVMANFAGNMTNVMAPAGTFQDLKPFLILPEVTDDDNWYLGFDVYGNDVSNLDHVFYFAMDLRGGFYVNRDLEPTGLTDVEELLDPKWKGKILIHDPASNGGGTAAIASLLRFKGEDFVTRLLRDQEPIIIEDPRTTAEWMVTGRVPIGIGVYDNFLDEFNTEGVGLSIERRLGWGHISPDGFAVYNNAPHPNATKVFVNWFLGDDGQRIWASSMANSRRMGMPHHPFQNHPDYDRISTYTNPDFESNASLGKDTIALAESLR
jgi:ABC-type Fe3+ transport system substrate-binding protein